MKTNPQPTTPTGHTPGPWRYVPGNESSFPFVDFGPDSHGGTCRICINESHNRQGPEFEATALLISQAPAMALELEELRAQKVKLVEALEQSQDVIERKLGEWVAVETYLVPDDLRDLKEAFELNVDALTALAQSTNSKGA